MKLCLITSVFTPYTRGGAESVVTNIVNGFKNTSHQIFIITTCPFHGWRSLWPQKFQENNLIIYRFYPLNLFSYLHINQYKKKPLWRFFWHGLDMFNLHSYLVIKHILKREKPQVVLTHVLKGIGYLTCRAIKNSQIKNIHTLHDVQLATPSGLILKDEENSWQNTFFLTKLYQFLNRHLFGSPQIVISSSKFLLDFYTQRGFFPYSQKIILTNPVNIKALKHKNIKTKEEKTFTFLFLGQVEKYKGILLLIKVFKKLLGEIKNENINLLIVGSGSALSEAKKMVENVETRDLASLPIKFLGYLPNHELHKIFGQVDCLIVPSLCYENSPTVIFESLSSGVPVIAARIGGIEFIRDGYNGFTFEAGDENDLLRIIKFVLQNKKQLTAMSVNCLESIKEIGVEKYIQKLEELII